MRRLVPAVTAVLIMAFTNLSLPKAQAFTMYRFTSHTFSGCSTFGRVGPTESACRTAYSTTWDENSENYRVVNGIQYWTVPFTGRYYIDAVGAGGGGNFAGYGARIADTFDLIQGEVIRILVGQAPSPWYLYIANGGGGGTFVVRSPYNETSTALVVAGGGGGAESATVISSTASASITTSGNAGSGTVSSTGAGAGGVNGNGGGTASASFGGGGGGGFVADGTPNLSWENAGGSSFLNGGALTLTGTGAYAVAGGFGGGGAANGKGNGGGSGGGGGYSGGGGSDNIYGESGGGGGSIVAGLNINRIMTSAFRAANYNGYVTITALSSPSISVGISGNVTSVAKGSAVNLTATVGQSAVVAFFADGKKLSGCQSVATNNGSAICSWKPAIQKSVSITASIVVGGSAYATSTPMYIGVSRRTNKR